MVPEIVVVVPAYNPGPLLERAVRSVLSQDFADLECIVVDDGSNEALDHIVEIDPSRVRFHRQTNMGVSAARNVGVALTDSRFIAFLDQDDEWLPGKLTAQRDLHLRIPQASFCHTRFSWTSAKGEIPSPPQDVDFEASLAARIHVCLSSVLVERIKHDTVGGHNPVLAQHQDWDYLLRLMMVFGPAVAPDDVYVRYHVHELNASRNYEANALEGEAVRVLYETWARCRGEAGALAALKRGRRVASRTHAHQAIDEARGRIRAGDAGGAAHHLWQALRYNPKAVVESSASFVRARVRPEETS